jgi:hypothetical protein
MEQADDEAITKAVTMINNFEDQFFEITYTLHPVNRPGEVRGKSSNVSWAAKEMIRRCGGVKDDVLFTIMDADTCFAQDYFLSLQYYYCKASASERRVLFFTPTTLFDR